MPSELSPKRIVEHQLALRDFNNAYVEYLQAGPHGAHELRSRVLALVPRASTAMEEADVGVVVRSPPVVPGAVYDGLSNVVFLHEQSGVYSGVPNHIQDVVRLATAKLEERRLELERKRHQPLYWLDRAVSAFFRFPSYLVAKLVGVPTPRIDKSGWGTALRAFEVVAAVLGVYWGGRQAGWW